MLIRSNTASRADFERATGWTIKPEGACKGDVCVPLQGVDSAHESDTIDPIRLAEAIGLPIVESPEHKLSAIGPEAVGERALTTATAPELELPDVNGNPFNLSSLRGQKVLVYAWAPY